MKMTDVRKTWWGVLYDLDDRPTDRQNGPHEHFRVACPECKGQILQVFALYIIDVARGNGVWLWFARCETCRAASIRPVAARGPEVAGKLISDQDRDAKILSLIRPEKEILGILVARQLMSRGPRRTVRWSWLRAGRVNSTKEVDGRQPSRRPKK